MTDVKNKVQDQLQEALDQINNNTNEAFGLLNTINQQIEKLAVLGIDECETIVKSGQNVSKDLVSSSMKTANEAVKVAKSCIEGSLNLIKQ